MTVRKPDRLGEAQKTYADSSAAKKLLGWKPTHTLTQGVKNYYDWYMAQPAWYKQGEY